MSCRRPDPTQLTPRHTEVMALMAQGLTNRQIAAHLGISPLTVKTHVVAIYARLEVDNRVSAVLAWRAEEVP